MGKGCIIYGMKRIGFITTNKVLAQSLMTIMKNYPELDAEPFMFLDPGQAVVDAEVLKIDVAFIDVGNEVRDESGAVSPFCEELREVLPDCRILLFVSQDDKRACEAAVATVREKAADDFVFYDSTLDYLFAKVLSLLKTSENIFMI